MTLIHMANSGRTCIRAPCSCSALFWPALAVAGSGWARKARTHSCGHLDCFIKCQHTRKMLYTRLIAKFRGGRAHAGTQSHLMVHLHACPNQEGCHRLLSLNEMPMGLGPAPTCSTHASTHPRPVIHVHACPAAGGMSPAAGPERVCGRVRRRDHLHRGGERAPAPGGAADTGA